MSLVYGTKTKFECILREREEIQIIEKGEINRPINVEIDKAQKVKTETSISSNK